MTLLRIDGFSATFTAANPVHAVIDVGLEVGEGERVGIIGESGSGKSVTAMSILRLHDEEKMSIGNGATIDYRGENILGMDEGQVRRLRGSEIGMIFQDPTSSLNPTRKVGKQVSRVLEQLEGMQRETARAKALELFEEVGLPDPRRIAQMYPHELSGGMRQRVLIAMVLAREPRLLIADEPTSALDVTVQAALLAMLKKRVRERAISVLLITHDLGVVAQFCDRVYVVYGGRIVEEGPVRSVLAQGAHPYTQALANCVPKLIGAIPEVLPAIPGRQESRQAIPSGCAFAGRCEYANRECTEVLPELRVVPHSGTRAACLRVDHVARLNAAEGPAPTIAGSSKSETRDG